MNPTLYDTLIPCDPSPDVPSSLDPGLVGIKRLAGGRVALSVNYLGFDVILAPAAAAALADALGAVPREDDA